MTTEQVVLDRLHESHKKILMLRYKKYKENPQAGDDWEIVKKRLTKKYAANTLKKRHLP